MAVVMVAMLAFGGTYAYFTATANTLTATGLKTGSVKLSATKEATAVFAQKALLPGDSLLADNITYSVDTTDTGNYVSVKITLTSTVTEFAEAVLAAEGFGIGSDWTKLDSKSTTSSFVYYTTAAVANAGTATVEAAKFVIPTTVNDNWDQANPSTTGTKMNIPVTLTVEARSVQASNIPSGQLETVIAGLWAQ